jgi:Icc-related predicted phosphoesterase
MAENNSSQVDEFKKFMNEYRGALKAQSNLSDNRFDEVETLDNGRKLAFSFLEETNNTKYGTEGDLDISVTSKKLDELSDNRLKSSQKILRDGLADIVNEISDDNILGFSGDETFSSLAGEQYKTIVEGLGQLEELYGNAREFKAKADNLTDGTSIKEFIGEVDEKSLEKEILINLATAYADKQVDLRKSNGLYSAADLEELRQQYVQNVLSGFAGPDKDTFKTAATAYEEKIKTNLDKSKENIMPKIREITNKVLKDISAGKSGYKKDFENITNYADALLN